MLTGSAYRVTVRAPGAGFRLLAGQPATYIKTAESGARRTHSFCANCGTPTYARAAENPTTYSLRIGCLAQRAALPRRQRWCGSSLAWSANIAHVPALDRQ